MALSSRTITASINYRSAPFSATLMHRGRRAALKTPSDACAEDCRGKLIWPRCPINACSPWCVPIITLPESVLTTKPRQRFSAVTCCTSNVNLPGLLPGIGGPATLALMLPFIFKMSPAEAFAFLLGMHSVAATTGDITSVLFGVPGEGLSAATVVDGHPMAKRGEAGRALGAALMSSLVGALIGAVFLALAVPIVRPLVLSFGSPELFMLSVVGISCITSLSGLGARGQIRGFAMGLFGLLLSTIGQERQSGSLRFDLGMMYLWDGLDLIPVLVGIFAIPEIVDLAVRGTAIAGEKQPGNLQAGVMEGIKDTFRHFWLVVRCSAVGVFIGILPGAGGGVAQWLAYAHAVHSAKDAKDRERFGKGDIRGVLGPGAANNSKEGGELIPTVALGLPGGGAMGILLGGFLIMGLTPGPDMLTKHLPITFSMVWTLVIANIITVLLCLMVLN